MKGTEKQITWAEDIKKAVIETMNDMIEMAKASNDPRITEAFRMQCITMWENRIEVVENWENASDVIEAFADFAKNNKATRARIINNAIKPRFTEANCLQRAIIATR